MILHDLHTHTDYSDGSHSIDLQVLIARAMGLKAIAFTDHFGPGWKLHDTPGAFDAYLADIDRVRIHLDDLIVLKGVEAAALDCTGRLSITEAQAARVEWVLCDLGGASEGTLRNTPASKRRYAENVVRTYMCLCDVPFLNVIAHPFNTGNTNPPLLPADYPRSLLAELAEKMARRGKVFDVMNLMVFWFQGAGISPAELTAQYADLVRTFAAAGVRFQVSSDDHRCGIGHTVWAEKVLKLARVPKSQTVDPAGIPLKKTQKGSEA